MLQWNKCRVSIPGLFNACEYIIVESNHACSWDSRVVKASDLKSLGQWPFMFESTWDRSFCYETCNVQYIYSLFVFYLYNVLLYRLNWGEGH